jgi:hypothetical protein
MGGSQKQVYRALQPFVTITSSSLTQSPTFSTALGQFGLPAQIVEDEMQRLYKSGRSNQMDILFKLKETIPNLFAYIPPKPSAITPN